MPPFLAVLVASLVPLAAAAEVGNNRFTFDEDTPVPAVVMALQDCGADERTHAWRQPFAGGFLFAIRCPGNNENSMQTLIFAEAEHGTGAHLLRFYGPDDIKDAFADVIANIRLYPETNEIGEIFVDREVEGRADPNVCRTEGRWRLEGKPPQPRLVFWRETADCEGNTGWTLIVGKR